MIEVSLERFGPQGVSIGLRVSVGSILYSIEERMQRSYQTQNMVGTLLTLIYVSLAKQKTQSLFLGTGSFP